MPENAPETQRPAGAAEKPTGVFQWPPVPSGRTLPVLGLHCVLQQTEWWPAEKLLAHQLRRIQSLIGHAQRTTPFYRDRLKEFASLEPGALTLDTFRRIPLLTRGEIQDARGALVASVHPPEFGGTFQKRTSGSTGRPLTVTKSHLVELFNRAISLRYYIWHRCDLGEKNVTFRSLDKPPRIRRGPWSILPGSGPGVLIDHGFPVPQLLDMLIAEDPSYLQVLPSTLSELLRVSAKTGKKPRSLREVRTVSEILDPEVRAFGLRIWGVPVTENYSCEEASIMALQCPEHEHLHVQSESVLLEVLDGDGNPCRPGQLGRIAVTALHNFAMPLIRYQLGDWAEAGPPCPCGRGLPVLRRIAGRVRNLARLPSGERVTFTLSAEIVNDLRVRQCQVVQKTLEEMEVRLVRDPPLGADEERRLADFYAAALGYPFSFRFVYVDEIPALPGGKFEAFRCEVPEFDDAGGTAGGAPN